MPEQIRAGDVVLVYGQDLISVSIAVGTILRYGAGTPYAEWTHAALVYEAPSQDPDTIRIVEATQASGVHTAFLSKYTAGKHKIVHTHVGRHDWEQVRDFLDRVLVARERYDLVAYLGLTLYALTGTRLCLQEAGTATCSGLVCDALTRAGFTWSRPPYACTPADIAADLDVEGFREIASRSPRLSRWAAPAIRLAAERRSAWPSGAG